MNKVHSWRCSGKGYYCIKCGIYLHSVVLTVNNKTLTELYERLRYKNKIIRKCLSLAKKLDPCISDNEIIIKGIIE